MQVRLTRPNRIEKGRAGDIVEVDPARARYLFSLKMAEPVQIREQIDAPEKTKLVEPGPAKITKPEPTEKAATGKTTAKAAKAAKGKK